MSAKKQISKDIELMPNARPDDIIIPIMGCSGVGKSTFINAIFGKTEMAAIGSNLERCTQQVSGFVYEITHDNARKRLVLVDTIAADPGDLSMVDAVAFERVFEWLEASYPQGTKFTGAVFLHSIADTSRINDSAWKKTVSFMQRLSTKSQTTPVLAISKFTENEKATDKEKLMKNIYWKEMIAEGSPVYRFDNTHESAWRIIDGILKKHKWTTDILQILESSDAIMTETEKNFVIQCLLEQVLKVQKENEKTGDKLQKALRRISVANPTISKGVLELLLERLRSWIGLGRHTIHDSLDSYSLAETDTSTLRVPSSENVNAAGSSFVIEKPHQSTVRM